jgi:hypothetical protein
MGSTVGLQEGASLEKLAFLSISEEHQHVPATQRARPVHSPTPPPPFAGKTLLHKSIAHIIASLHTPMDPGSAGVSRVGVLVLLLTP